MKQITEFLNKYKITIGFVAGSVVIATQYATCTIKPNIGGDDARIQVQEPNQEKETSQEEGDAKEEEAD
jgi:hypothetical protein